MSLLITPKKPQSLFTCLDKNKSTNELQTVQIKLPDKLWSYLHNLLVRFTVNFWLIFFIFPEFTVCFYGSLWRLCWLSSDLLMLYIPVHTFSSLIIGLLSVSEVQLRPKGDRALAVRALKLWNNKQQEFRSTESVSL